MGNKVIVYSGEHCQPCRMLKTVLDSKNLQYETRLAKDYADIVSVPTIDMIKDDEVVERLVGANGTTVVKIEKWLKND